jgi:hypothetical protein
MNSRVIHRKAFKLTLILLLVALGMRVYAEDIPAGAWAGTWKFDPARSKFPGPPPQADQIITQPDGTILVHETSAEGKTRDWSYKPQVGKAVAVQGHGENVTVLVKKVNAHRMEQTWDYNGKPATSYATLSRDGKTQTFHVMRTKDGQPFEEIIVFEKQ